MITCGSVGDSLGCDASAGAGNAGPNAAVERDRGGAKGEEKDLFVGQPDC